MILHAQLYVYSYQIKYNYDFKNKIDIIVRVYDDDLTEDEILKNYNSEVNRF